MNIYDLADVLDRNLIITRQANNINAFRVGFGHCEIKQGTLLIGAYGRGNTVKEALNSFTRQISRQTLVFDVVYPDYRVEFVVPVLSFVEDI